MTRFYPPSVVPYARPAEMGGLKKILRKIAPVIGAGAAIAAGQPQLAVAAASGASSLTKKKKKGVVEAPVVIPQPAGFLDNMLPADRNALLIGGAVVGTLLVAKVVWGAKR
jgi:hypothetical protein